MDRSWLYAQDRQFMLSASSAIAAPGPDEMRVPKEALRVLLVRSGACRIAIAGREEHLIGDRMLLIGGGAAYRVEAPTEDLLMTQVDVSNMPCPEDGYCLRQLYQQYPDYRRLCEEMGEYVSFHDRYALVRFTAESLGQYAAYDPASRSLNLSMALSYMLLVIASAAYERQTLVYRYNKHVRRAIEYIHENYMRGITAEDIASYVGVHTGHLHRLFRTEMGTRVTEYLTNLRLEKAKTLLKRTDIPITYITFLVGISSQQYLSRLFRQHVGMTPQAYRRSYNITCDYDVAGLHYETIAFPEELGKEEGAS